eukprot:scaffold57070_cov86-Phaeocystis_antarctica.AAC.2
MHVGGLCVRVLDTAKRLADPATAPRLGKGPELAAVVVAGAGIERVTRHMLRATRPHICWVQWRRCSTAWLQLEPQ